MLGSLVVAQMDRVAYEGLDGPAMHGTVGAKCAQALDER